MEGFVKTLKFAHRFVFIAAEDGRDYFAHISELDYELDQDGTLQDRRVRFEVGQTLRGPCAKNVRALH